jgi:energy-coupling factor transport system ATP-binding protein
VRSEGRVALQGTPRQVFAREASLHALGLDLPPSARLARLLHGRVADFPADLLTPSQMVAALEERIPARGGTR